MQFIKKFKYKSVSILKILIYKYFFNTHYEFGNIRSNELIIHHHSGLGDAVICNGIVNFLSRKFDKIYLAAYEKIYDHLDYLYSENESVELIKYKDAINLYKKNTLPKLRVGFEKNKKNFNVAFYEQLSLDYQISYDYFYIPPDESKENKLLEHLKNEYQIEDDFSLIHQVSSYGEVNLNVKSSLQRIYVEKETDIFKNIFLYKKVIENAKEIHCIDSSFLHLVERVPTDAKLYFHNYKTKTQKPEKLILKKDWIIIN